MSRTMEELTGGDTGTVSWVPADSYVNLIIEASVSHSQLSGVITAVNYNMQSCDGDKIQVRYIRPRVAQGPKGEGINDCLSATSSTIGTQEIQIKKYGDYDRIPGFTSFEVCGDLEGAILLEMAKGLAKKRDELVWDDIYACSPHWTEYTHGVWSATPEALGSCCTYAFDLYNSIVGAQKVLQGKGLYPDYVVMHPSVSKYLFFTSSGGVQPVLNSLIQYKDGVVTGINGMQVIECANALTGTASSGATLAVVLDSRISCAEAWGKVPNFTSDYDGVCDVTKNTVWIYWGSSAISGTTVAGQVEGVAHICNP